MSLEGQRTEPEVRERNRDEQRYQAALAQALRPELSLNDAFMVWADPANPDTSPAKKFRDYLEQGGTFDFLALDTESLTATLKKLRIEQAETMH